MLSAVSRLWLIRVEDLDLKLLRILQRTATMPVAEIGERIGLSHTPCWRRMRRLEESGVILRRVAILSPGSVDLPVSVFASITMASHQNTALNSFERAVQKETQFVDCHAVTGTSDYLLKIIVPDVAAYERYLKEQLEHLPNVGQVHSSFRECAVVPEPRFMGGKLR